MLQCGSLVGSSQPYGLLATGFSLAPQPTEKSKTWTA